MKLVSLNVALPQDVLIKGRPVPTGIYKQPVAGTRWLRRLGVDGDGQADLNVHGGVDRAVYAYPWEHYAAWSEELGRQDFVHGQFGENLTVEELLEDVVCIGDRFRIGTAEVEVSQPRVPCFKLAHKMGLPEFPKRFLESLRSGFYLRVIEEGEAQAGDLFQRTSTSAAKVTVQQVIELFYFDKTNATLARQLAAEPALSPDWRAELVKRFGF